MASDSSMIPEVPPSEAPTTGEPWPPSLGMRGSYVEFRKRYQTDKMPTLVILPCTMIQTNPDFPAANTEKEDSSDTAMEDDGYEYGDASSITSIPSEDEILPNQGKRLRLLWPENASEEQKKYLLSDKELTGVLQGAENPNRRSWVEVCAQSYMSDPEPQEWAKIHQSYHAVTRSAIRDVNDFLHPRGYHARIATAEEGSSRLNQRHGGETYVELLYGKSSSMVNYRISRGVNLPDRSLYMGEGDDIEKYEVVPITGFTMSSDGDPSTPLAIGLKSSSRVDWESEPEGQVLRTMFGRGMRHFLSATDEQFKKIQEMESDRSQSAMNKLIHERHVSATLDTTRRINEIMKGKGFSLELADSASSFAGVHSQIEAGKFSGFRSLLIGDDSTDVTIDRQD